MGGCEVIDAAETVGISESQDQLPGGGRMPRVRTPSFKGQAEEEGAVEQRSVQPTEEPGSLPGRNFKKGLFRKHTVGRRLLPSRKVRTGH